MDRLRRAPHRRSSRWLLIAAGRRRSRTLMTRALAARAALGRAGRRRHRHDRAGARRHRGQPLVHRAARPGHGHAHREHRHRPARLPAAARRGGRALRLARRRVSTVAAVALLLFPLVALAHARPARAISACAPYGERRRRAGAAAAAPAEPGRRRRRGARATRPALARLLAARGQLLRLRRSAPTG